MPYEREMIAVQEGIAKHRAMSLTSSEATAEYRLRRNIHRIEKGIAVADGKRAFAEDYLGDTVCILSNLLHSMTGCHGDNWELTTWAIRILDQYFAVVPQTEIIMSEKVRYRNLRHSIIHGLLPRVSRGQLIEKDPDTQKLFEDMMRKRHSVRQYLEKPVGRGVIDKAVEIARLAPSACNRQAFFYHIFDYAEDVENIRKLTYGISCFSDYIPGIALLIGTYDAYEYEYDRHLPFVDASLSAMCFVQALWCEGVGSCFINWPDSNEYAQGLKEIVNLEPWHLPIMAITYGYPSNEYYVPESVRKSVNAMRSYHKKG